MCFLTSPHSLNGQEFPHSGSTRDSLFDFQDPEVMAAFQDVSQNPANLSNYQHLPKVQMIVDKLAEKFGPAGSGPPPDTSGFPGGGFPGGGFPGGGFGGGFGSGFGGGFGGGFPGGGFGGGFPGGMPFGNMFGGGR